MDIWDWVAHRRAEAQSQGDRLRLRLADLHGEAYSFRHTAPTQMLALLEEGKRLAALLQEPWWGVFFDYWIAQTLRVYLSDYRQAIERALQLVLELRKPTMTEHPLKFSAWRNLVAAYVGVDPRGYAQAIAEALAELQRQVPENGHDRYDLLGLWSWFVFEVGRYDEARAQCVERLALLDSEPNHYTTAHYQITTYTRLCHITYKQGDQPGLLEYARQGEELTRGGDYRFQLALCLLWQALALRLDKQEEPAQRLYRQASARMARLGMFPNNEYQDALAGYHEAGGDFEAAWVAREIEFNGIRDRGQLACEADCRLQRCRLLLLLGRPVEEEAAALREAAALLRDPSWHLAELEKLLAG